MQRTLESENCLAGQSDFKNLMLLQNILKEKYYYGRLLESRCISQTSFEQIQHMAKYLATDVITDDHTTQSVFKHSHTKKILSLRVQQFCMTHPQSHVLSDVTSILCPVSHDEIDSR